MVKTIVAIEDEEVEEEEVDDVELVDAYVDEDVEVDEDVVASNTTHACDGAQEHRNKQEQAHHPSVIIIHRLASASTLLDNHSLSNIFATE